MEPERNSQSMYVVGLGLTDYKECWDLQRRTFMLRSEGAIEDTLLLTEHNHVYTIGRGGNVDHLLDDEQELAARGVQLYFNDRGGDITYHGPGQFVGYPIFDLRKRSPDLHRYLRDLEEVIIHALRTFGVTGERIEGYTGVWVSGEKICAIGIKSSRWVTMHGFALNVNTDLSFFDRIIPCGIFERGVTSLKTYLGYAVDMQEVLSAIVGGFENIFGFEAHTLSPAQFAELLEKTEVNTKTRITHDTVR